MFSQILQEIKNYDTIVIHRHSKPDGDALGSQIGLKHILQDNFPEKRVYTVGDGAGRYAFMDGSVMDEIDDDVYENALAVILDCGASALISDERYKTAKKTIRFDHHIFGERIADLEVVDTAHESCCSLITRFAVEQNLRLSPASAKALYTGMVTDSGRFRYDSTSAQTFYLAAKLLEQPLNITDIYSKLYEDELFSLQLRAKFTLKIQQTEKGVAYIYTDKEEAKGYGVDTFTISRGMVGVMADIRGIDIWVNFTETEEGKVLAEIRSSKYTVQPVAVKHGGGGHAKACGATLKDRAEAMELLEELNSFCEVSV